MRQSSISLQAGLFLYRGKINRRRRRCTWPMVGTKDDHRL